MSLLETRLVNFRSDVPDFDKYEVTAGDYGGLRAFQKQTASPTGIITEDLTQKALKSIGSTLEIPVLNKETFTIQNVSQPLVIAGNPSTSALYVVTFIDYYFGFRLFPAQHYNNDIKLQREFNRKMKGYEISFMEALETAALAAFEAGKTQVLADDLGKYSFASNTVEADWTLRDEFVGDLGLLFKGNKLGSRLDVVANLSFDSIVRNRLKEQGEANERNKRYQYDDKTWFSSTNIANPAGKRATAFCIAEDSIGMVQQQSVDAILGNETHNHIWDLDTLPMSGIPVSVMFYDGAIDGSGLNASTTHLTATKVESYGISTRVAFITTYNSDRPNIPAPIMKVVLNNPPA